MAQGAFYTRHRCNAEVRIPLGGGFHEIAPGVSVAGVAERVTTCSLDRGHEGDHDPRGNWPVDAIKEMRDVHRELAETRARLLYLRLFYPVLRERIDMVEGGITCAMCALYQETEHLVELLHQEVPA